MKKVTLFAALLVLLTSCQRGCTSLSRSIEMDEREYSIVMFSGGDTVFTDTFIGMVNNSENSDGIYYYKDGELIEVSGDYVLKSK